MTEILRAAGARRYWFIWFAVAPIALWALVRGFGLERGGLPTTVMFFTPWAAVAALVVAVTAAGLRNWAAAAVAAVTMSYLAIAVAPRATGDESVSAEGRETFTVLSANVYLGDADPRALIALVDRYDPDLLSVQELTPSFAVELRRAGIDRRLPNSVLMTRPRGRGGGLYARHRLKRLPGGAELPFRMPRAVLALPDGGRLRVVAVHPEPPHMSLDRWQGALASLPATGRGAPWILAGDFNATFDVAEFRKLADAGYRDAGAATGNGLEPTWPGDEGFPLGLITIDHVLADRRLGVVEYGIDELHGSDHRAIHARLVLP